jgi:hypothetical protein
MTATEIDLMIRNAGAFDLKGMETAALLGMAVLGKKFRNDEERKKFGLLVETALATGREALDPLIDRIRKETQL